ncbi:MAG: triphosphoribosyl-dephospho-CoA synthase [Shinella sp.]|nr:triphosphoribosyl-dephospho-CoA synthase [Shinella sp.]
MTAYKDACRGEVEALKPGNVHRFADGHRMTAAQFLESAEITGDPISQPGCSVGRRILDAAAATRSKIGANTNLGILLLCAPLAKAAEGKVRDLRESLADVLEGLTPADARDVFGAIRLANPGGLGKAEKHDVSEEPSVSLLEAMREASHRDLIARQYDNGFDDIFSIGFAAHAQAVSGGEHGMWPTVFIYLRFLSSFPDSHVARKHGSALAEDIRNEAEEIHRQVRNMRTLSEREKALLDFDRRLKERSVNPGTSADLTVATLFGVSINFILHNREVNG